MPSKKRKAREFFVVLNNSSPINVHKKKGDAKSDLAMLFIGTEIIKVREVIPTTKRGRK